MNKLNFTLFLIFLLNFSLIVSSSSSGSNSSDEPIVIGKSCTIYLNSSYIPLAGSESESSGSGSESNKWCGNTLAYPCVDITSAIDSCYSNGTVEGIHFWFANGVYNITKTFSIYNLTVEVRPITDGPGEIILNYLGTGPLFEFTEPADSSDSSSNENIPDDKRVVSFLSLNGTIINNFPEGEHFVAVSVQKTAVFVNIFGSQFSNLHIDSSLFSLETNYLYNESSFWPYLVHLNIDDTTFSSINTTNANIIDAVNVDLQFIRVNFTNNNLLTGNNLLFTSNGTQSIVTCNINYSTVYGDNTTSLLYIINSNNIVISQSQFSWNSVAPSAQINTISAVFIQNAATSSISNSDFSLNNGYFMLWIDSCTQQPITIAHNQFNGNKNSNGVIYVINSSQVTIADPIINGNSINPQKTILIVNFSKSVLLSNIQFNSNNNRFGNFDGSQVMVDGFSGTGNTDFILYYCLETALTIQGPVTLTNNSISQSGLLDCATGNTPCTVKTQIHSVSCDYETPSSSEQNSKDNQSSKSGKSDKPSDKTKIIIIVVCVVGALVAVGVIAFVIRRRHHHHHHRYTPISH